jgi:hypothetical protein
VQLADREIAGVHDVAGPEARELGRAHVQNVRRDARMRSEREAPRIHVGRDGAISQGALDPGARDRRGPGEVLAQDARGGTRFRAARIRVLRAVRAPMEREQELDRARRILDGALVQAEPREVLRVHRRGRE